MSVDKWLPPEPATTKWVTAQTGLTLRLTPSSEGIKRMGIARGTRLRIAPDDVCRLYLSPYRFVRVIQVGKWLADEALYVALEVLNAEDKRTALYLK